MASENITDKIVENVGLASKVANIVGNAFKTTFSNVDHSSGTEENLWINYFTSFGLHISMIIIVILLKWQYGIN